VYGLFHPRTWSLDIVVFTPAEVAKWGAERYSLITEIERTGRILYDRTDGQRG